VDANEVRWREGYELSRELDRRLCVAELNGIEHGG
jgi:hypothetical protein